LRKRGAEDLLNEDDLALVQEAMGGDAKRTKTFDNASQLQSELFGHEEDSEEEKEKDEIVGQKTTTNDGYESGEAGAKRQLQPSNCVTMRSSLVLHSTKTNNLLLLVPSLLAFALLSPSAPS